MSLVQSARDVYQSEGLIELLRQGLVMGVQNGKKKWYNSRDLYDTDIAGCSATFPSPVDRGGKMTRQTIEREEESLEAVLSTLRPDDIFWDIGANLGVYSCLASDKVREGDIISVEPNPQNADLLRTNLSLNDATNAKTLEIAISDSNGTIDFSVPQRQDFSPRGTIAPNDNEEIKTVEIEQRRLQQAIEEFDLPAPTVMKIDIEGAEALAVDGFRGAVDQCRVIFSEIHTNEDAAQSIYSYGMTLDEYCSRLESFGFQNKVLDSNGSEVHLMSVKPLE